MTLVCKEVISELLLEREGDPRLPSASKSKRSESGAPAFSNIVIDPSRNEALEAARPGEDVFKAVFGSDGEDEEDGD